MYFTTDEKIKEGDKVLHDGEVKTAILLGMFLGFKWKDADKDRYEHFNKNNLPRKIVATTNPELWKPSMIRRGDGCPFYLQKNGLYQATDEHGTETLDVKLTEIPKIDIPFIEFYIKAYNRGKPITEVLLEQPISYMESEFHKVEVQYKQQLTRRANGSVVIYLEEEKKYTREELKIAVRDTLWGAKGFSPMGQDDYDDFDKYFNERFPE